MSVSKKKTPKLQFLMKNDTLSAKNSSKIQSTRHKVF